MAAAGVSLPDPAAREALARALLAASRPSADRLVEALQGRPGVVAADEGRWNRIHKTLGDVLDPVKRLHPQQHAAQTKRSLRSRLFRNDPSSSVKLDQRMLPRSALRPRLSTLEARILAEAHTANVGADLRRRLRDHLERISAEALVPQHQTVPGAKPQTWIDSHPRPEALRAGLIAFRDAEQSRGDATSQAQARQCVDAIVADIDAALLPCVEDPNHPLHLDRIAADAAAALWAEGVRIDNLGERAAGLAALTQAVRPLLVDEDAAQRGRTALRVLREHLTPDQLRAIDAHCAAA
jgi:hypothetical protein